MFTSIFLVATTPTDTSIQVARDEANLSKGYGFVSFTTFESSDDAIANMHGQYLMNKEITVQYAYKKDGKGERHGDAAERALAASGRKHNVEAPVQPLPPQLFTNGAPTAPAAMASGAPPTQMDPRAAGAMYGQSPVQPMAMGMPMGMNMGMNVPPMNMPAQTMGIPPSYSPAPQHLSSRTQTPLQPPPPAAGVPARPPPSAAGYNAPQGYGPPAGFGGAPPGMPPQGFPPGMPPPGFAPPGGMPPQGFPPGAPPPGMQPQNGYGAPPGYQPRR